MEDGMRTIRAFIAIPLSTEVQALLGVVSQTWSEQVPERSVRWVKPHLMHITLRFLGDTQVASLRTVAGALDRIAAQNDAFTLRLDRPGCFPNNKRPRVIWIGLQGQLETARALKQEIDEALIPLGWEQENRSFRPHLTIGRVKDSRKVRGFRWEANVEPLPIPVQTIHLIESTLHPAGPVYTVRHKAVFRN
jgi:2'-5' RNA ligase